MSMGYPSGARLQWLPRAALGQAGLIVQYATWCRKKSPALARASGGGRVLPPRTPTSTGRMQAPN